MYNVTWTDFTNNVSQMNEAELYLKLDELVSDIELNLWYLCYMKIHKSESLEKRSKLADIDNTITESTRRANYIIALTKKFGTDAPSYSDDNNSSVVSLVQFNEKLKWWMSFWKKWVDNTDPKIIDAIKTCKISRVDAKQYYPKGTWKDVFYSNTNRLPTNKRADTPQSVETG